MNAIFKQNNVYVMAPKGDVRSDVNVKEITELVYNHELYNSVNLYGGRVAVNWNGDSSVILRVDGIQIYGYCNLDNGLIGFSMSLNKAVAYLNQIENLGVDTFLSNYKEQLKKMKEEVEILATKIEQGLQSQYDETKDKVLKDLNRIIRILCGVIFMLMINLNAGLDNHVYDEAYNDIVNLYF